MEFEAKKSDKNRRQELREQFEQIKVYIGIYQITNLKNGKIYLDSAQNLKDKWRKIKEFQLEINRFTNLELQKEWNLYGEEAFQYEVLEEKEVEENTDVRWELEQMKKRYLEKKQPYGERGYHRLPK